MKDTKCNLLLISCPIAPGTLTMVIVYRDQAGVTWVIIIWKMKKQHHHLVSPAKIFLYTGILILLFALLYLVGNSGEADTVVHLWVPFIMAGVALLLTSIFVK